MAVAASVASLSAGVVLQRDQIEIGRPLRHRFERLAVKAHGRAHPEGINRIGKQQHFDIARLVALKLRAGRRLHRVLAGEIIDRRLVLLQARDIVLQANRSVLGCPEAGELKQLVAVLHVLIEPFLDHRAEDLPHLRRIFPARVSANFLSSPSTLLVTALRIAATCGLCCSISRERLSGMSSESMTPRTKRR